MTNKKTQKKTQTTNSSEGNENFFGKLCCLCKNNMRQMLFFCKPNNTLAFHTTTPPASIYSPLHSANFAAETRSK